MDEYGLELEEAEEDDYMTDNYGDEDDAVDDLFSEAIPRFNNAMNVLQPAHGGHRHEAHGQARQRDIISYPRN